MALGGFSGSDQILSVDELAGMVADGRVRFFLLSPNARGRQSDLTRWVAEQCTVVPQEVGGSAPAGRGGPTQLLDCGSVQG
jgi:hypothetical protein